MAWKADLTSELSSGNLAIEALSSRELTGEKEWLRENISGTEDVRYKILLKYVTVAHVDQYGL